jgi:hypothetical protein
VRGEFEDRIRSALRRVTDYVAIEEEAWQLLARSYPALAPVVGGNDQGRDGLVLDVGGGRLAVVSVSVEPGWAAKFKDDVAKARASATPPEAAILCTTQRITASKLKDLETELNIPVLPHGEEWWISQLAREDLQSRDIRLRLVGIGPRGLTALMSADEYAGLLRRRIGFVDVPLVGREVDLESALIAIQPGSILLVSGPPGIGKSRFLIELARRFGPNAAFIRPHSDSRTTLVGEALTQDVQVMLLDDSHQYPGLVDTARAVLEAPEIDRPPALVLGSWASTLPTVREHLRGFTRIESRELSRLSRRDIAKLLSSEGVALEPEAARVAVAVLSEGLPVIAILAAEALQSGGDIETVVEAGPLSAWLEGVVAGNIYSRRDSMLMSSLALISPIQVAFDSSVDDDLSATARAFGRTREELLDVVESLISAGLADASGSTVRIVPETAARYLSLSGVRAKGHDADLMRAGLAELSAKHWDKLAQNLAAISTGDADAPAQLAVDLLPEWHGGTADEAVYRLRQLKSVAYSAPLRVLAELELILGSELVSEKPNISGLVYSTGDVINAAVEVVSLTKYREPHRSIAVLIRLAGALEYKTVDRRVQNAALQEIASICRYLPDPPTSHDAMSLRHSVLASVRAAMDDGVVAPRVLAHVLGETLDPTLESHSQSAESALTINMRGGFVPAQGFEGVASEALALARELTNRSADAVAPLLSALDTLTRGAMGVPGLFGALPREEDVNSYSRAACELVALLSSAAPTHNAVQYRLWNVCQRRWSCNHKLDLRLVSELAALSHEPFRPDNWELSRKRGQLRLDRWARRWVKNGWEAGLRRIEELSAEATAFDVSAYKIGDAIAAMAQVSDPELSSAFTELFEHPALGPWAHTVLVPAWNRGDAVAFELVRSLVAANDPARRQAGMSILSGGNRGFRKYGGLVALALANATDEDAASVQLLLFGIASTNVAKRAVLALASSSSDSLRWLALAALRLGRQPRGKPYPIYVPVRELDSVERALRSLAGFSPGTILGLERGIEGVVGDLARLNPNALLDWLVTRYEAMASRPPGSEGRFETLSDAEIDAVGVLSTDEDIGLAILRWFAGAFPSAGYRFATDAPEMVRAVLGPSWGVRASHEFELNPPADGVARAILREAPFGPQWISLATFVLRTTGVRGPAQIASLAEPNSWTDSPSPELRKRAAALRQAATSATPAVALGFDRAAIWLDERANDHDSEAMREEFR